MSEWITDRRPSWEDDLVSGLVFVSLPEVNRVIIKSAVEVVLGEPWQRIPTPDTIREDLFAERQNQIATAAPEMLKALIDVSYILEKSRIWGGMGWHYNELHPMYVTKARDIARAAIAKAEGRNCHE